MRTTIITSLFGVIYKYKQSHVIVSYSEVLINIIIINMFYHCYTVPAKEMFYL